VKKKTLQNRQTISAELDSVLPINAEACVL
jgi:hypothetical protein